MSTQAVAVLFGAETGALKKDFLHSQRFLEFPAPFKMHTDTHLHTCICLTLVWLEDSWWVSHSNVVSHCLSHASPCAFCFAGIKGSHKAASPCSYFKSPDACLRSCVFQLNSPHCSVTISPHRRGCSMMPQRMHTFKLDTFWYVVTSSCLNRNVFHPCLKLCFTFSFFLFFFPLGC